MEEGEFYTWFAEHYKTQRFSFPELTPLDAIVFERLTQQNAQALCQLFQHDASPFVDERFKNAAGADMQNIRCFAGLIPPNTEALTGFFALKMVFTSASFTYMI